MSETVLYTIEDSVATITLNRPESLNSMSAELLNALAETAARAAADEAVRCVLITGAGRAFCAGGDISGMVPSGPGGENRGLVSRADVLRAQEEVSRLLNEMPKPTISAVNGHAVGAGLSVALSADLVIASEQAKFGTAFANVGFSGDFGGTWLLQRLVGPQKAKELYLLGEIITADKALALGIVTKVVPHADLMAEAMALAKRLASGPTKAYGRMKDNFSFGATATFADTLTREAQNMVDSGKTADNAEALRAFLEKRPPAFVGR